MPTKKISELTSGTAALTSVLPASNSAGTATNKVTVQSILDADTRWDLFKPGVPTSLSGTIGNAQVVLTWTAPSVAAQTPITDYVVQYSSNSGSTWTTFADGTSGSTGATVTGLTNGTAYVFRVAAVNGVGQGAYTSASSAYTPSDAVYRAIPTMTSASAPSGTVTVAGKGSGDDWAAFDGNDGTYIRLSRQGYNDPVRSIVYSFPSGQKSRISGYTIKPNAMNGAGNPNYQAPAQWVFYASDDGTTWTQIETRTGQASDTGGSWTADETKTYTLSSPVNYRAYKWAFATGDEGPNDIDLATVQLVQ